jgi:uncharacterized iron-regulated membrane protein
MRHPTLQVGRHLGAALAIGAIAAPLAAAQSPDSVERNRDVAQQRALDRDRGLDKVTPDARDAADGRLPDAVPAPVIVRVTRHETSPLDWGDVAIGAGGGIGIVLLASGATLTVSRRRHHARLA